jgi:pimeloyl-ACP methyl ester carboxylesterase
MRTVTLSGWGQPVDALRGVVPPEAMHLDYAAFSPTEWFATAERREADLVVGWSLGGQLAVRMIASGRLAAQRLVLVAAPYQFVESEELRIGMSRAGYEDFARRYERNPARTLRRAWELAIFGDSRADRVREAMGGHDAEAIARSRWGNWLTELGRFSCSGVDLARLPPTLLIQGVKDAVVGCAQAGHFAGRLPSLRVLGFEECGHAPHWHDAAGVRLAIQEWAGG